MAASKLHFAMAKQMIEISTSKTVENNLGYYNSRTYQGKQWTRAEYEHENENGLPGRQYGVRDWSRASLNFEVVIKNGIPTIQPIDHTKPSLQERWQQRINQGYKATVKTKKGEVKKPIKKSEIKLIMFDLGGDRDRMHELAFDGKVNLGKRGIGTNGTIGRKKEIENWASDCYGFMAKKFGAENIIDFVVHLDETNPHIHCLVVPLTRDGKLSYTELFGGSREQAMTRAEKDGAKPNYRKGISDYHLSLHTDFAKEVGDKWGLERGDDIKITGAVHKSTAESLREKNRLEEEIQDAEEAAKVAEEALSLKNKALAKLGMSPVRKKTELENENDSLRAEKEEAERLAVDEKKKASAAAERAKTAYSLGIDAGKKQMEKAKAEEVEKAKREMRQSIPAEIRRKARLAPVEQDGVEQVADALRVLVEVGKMREEELNSIKKTVDLMEKERQKDSVILKAILRGLMAIPVIREAINALSFFFNNKVAHHEGLTRNQVERIDKAMSEVEGEEARRNFGRALVDLVCTEVTPSDYVKKKVQSEMDMIAEGTHRKLERDGNKLHR